MYLNILFILYIIIFFCLHAMQMICTFILKKHLSNEFYEMFYGIIRVIFSSMLLL